MISNIRINGFKSFIAETINLGKLTLLTGLNSSGKSSVIQSLLLLERAAKDEEIYLDGHGSLAESKNPYATEGIEISAEFETGDILMIKNDISTRSPNINFPELIYISADRHGPETSMPINISNNKLGRKGENIFKCIEKYADVPLNELLKHEKSEGETFLFNLRAWLKVVSPNANFKHHLQTMSDSSYGTFNDFRAKNVGFGLSYALPVITALLLGTIEPNSIVIIENPEAHLHPRGQTEIARLISLCVQAGAQVIIETHSDHLFDGIRIFTKKSEVDFHKMVKLYWFELDKNQNTQIEEAVMDKNGRLEIWPEGMFDQFEINASKLL